MSAALSAAGFQTTSSTYDDGLRQALFAWVGNENLEMRWSEEPKVERTVLEILLGESP